jgi:hypothetical protein
MARSVLKPHATAFLGILRLVDPGLAVAVGLVAYSLYLGDWPPADRYLVFLGTGAMTIAALFPLFGLYEPQRGISLAEELRRLVLAWGMLAALSGG